MSLRISRLPGDYIDSNDTISNYLGYSPANTASFKLTVGNLSSNDDIILGPAPVVDVTMAAEFETYLSSQEYDAAGITATRAIHEIDQKVYFSRKNDLTVMHTSTDADKLIRANMYYRKYEELLKAVYDHDMTTTALADRVAATEKFAAEWGGSYTGFRSESPALNSTTHFGIRLTYGDNDLYFIQIPRNNDYWHPCISFINSQQSYITTALRRISDDAGGEGTYVFNSFKSVIERVLATDTTRYPVFATNHLSMYTTSNSGAIYETGNTLDVLWVNNAEEVARADAVALSLGVSRNDLELTLKWPGDYTVAGFEQCLNKAKVVDELWFEDITLSTPIVGGANGELTAGWMSYRSLLTAYSDGISPVGMSNEMLDLINTDPGAHFYTVIKGSALKVGEILTETQLYADAQSVSYDIYNELVVDDPSKKLTWKELDNKAKQLGERSSIVVFDSTKVGQTSKLTLYRYSWAVNALGELVGTPNITGLTEYRETITPETDVHRKFNDLHMEEIPISGTTVDLDSIAVTLGFIDYAGYTGNLATYLPTFRGITSGQYTINWKDLLDQWAGAQRNTDELCRLLLGCALYENKDMRLISESGYNSLFIGKQHIV
jgi:hypothetical protein